MTVPKRPWSVDGSAILDAEGRLVNIYANPDVINHIVTAVNKLEPQPKTPGMCVVCNVNPVTPEEGEDTCSYCREKINPQQRDPKWPSRVRAMGEWPGT